MCLAYPGKIIKHIDDQHALVDFDGIVKKVNISLVDTAVGEYVVVHAGFAIEKMTQDDAWVVLKTYEEARKIDT